MGVGKRVGVRVWRQVGMELDNKATETQELKQIALLPFSQQTHITLKLSRPEKYSAGRVVKS
jgi:hypothetical protein